MARTRNTRVLRSDGVAGVRARLTLPLIAIVLALGAAACGSDGNGDSSGNGAEATTAGAIATTAPADLETTIGAFGLGVSDLRASADFYARVFGLRELTTYDIPGYMNEIVLGYGNDTSRGSALVLMHYTDGKEHNYTNNPAKIVLYVPDPVATIEKIRAEGLAILREPEPLGDTVVGLARDPDGYVLEILQATGENGAD